MSKLNIEHAGLEAPRRGIWSVMRKLSIRARGWMHRGGDF